MSYNGGIYYYIYNAQNDVTGLADKDGNIVVTYLYDSWGNIVSVTGTMASTLGVDNPFRYRGYFYDEETKYYYLQSRYYDPSVGRFLNADDIGGALSICKTILGSNMFAYCENNPVMGYDPSGRINLGKNWWNSRDFVAGVINTVVIVAGLGWALYSGNLLVQQFKTATYITRLMRLELQKRFGLTVGTIFNSLYSIIGSFLSWFTWGGIIAAALDWADKWVGSPGYNGYVLG